MLSQSVVLHIEIIDHLENDTLTSSTLLAQAHTEPRAYHYLEQDQSTQVDLTCLEDGLTLVRKGAWQTHIRFMTQGLGTFTVITDQGELSGTVKLIQSRLDASHIQLQYQLMMDGSVITHQTLSITIRGAQA